MATAALLLVRAEALNSTESVFDVGLLIDGLEAYTVEPVAVTGLDGSTSRLSPLGMSLVTIMFALMSVATLGGNVLVCLAVILVRKLRQPSNYLLVSLAISDFFVGCFVMPFAFAYLIFGTWNFGPAACAFWTSADVSLCTASILNLCAISVDKYAAITRPLSYQRTPRKMICGIICVWVGSLLISAVPLIAFQKKSARRVEFGSCLVSQNLFYQIYATMGSFYVPTAVMLIVNYKILQAARRLSAADSAACSSARNSYSGSTLGRLRADRAEVEELSPLEESESLATSAKGRLRLPLLRRLKKTFQIDAHGGSWFRREGKALKTLGIIMGAFITCWLPFFTLALIKPLCPAARFPPWLDWLALWLGYANSALNPLIYAKYNRDFRIPFREMICCRFSTLQSVMRTEMFAERFGPPEANGRTRSEAEAPSHPLTVLSAAENTSAL